MEGQIDLLELIQRDFHTHTAAANLADPQLHDGATRFVDFARAWLANNRAVSVEYGDHGLALRLQDNRVLPLTTVPPADDPAALQNAVEITKPGKPGIHRGIDVPGSRAWGISGAKE